MLTPTGYTLVTPSLDDIPDVTVFIQRWDLEVAGLNDFYEDDLRQLTSRPTFDPQRDWWALRSAEGIAALGMVWGEDPGVRYSGFGLVDIQHLGRGLGTHVLDLIEQRLNEVASDRPIVLHLYVDEKDPLGRSLVRARGFEVIRRNYTMMKDIAGEPEPTIPNGVIIRNATSDDLPLMHLLLEDTFSEHFGFAPTPFDTWATGFTARTDTSPDLQLLADVDGEPSAICLCTINDGMGWVSDLGVLKRHRGRGIARALLLRSFQIFEARGCSRAGLGVDASNETGAVQLYESVGMSAARVYEAYLKKYGS